MLGNFSGNNLVESLEKKCPYGYHRILLIFFSRQKTFKLCMFFLFYLNAHSYLNGLNK